MNIRIPLLTYALFAGVFCACVSCNSMKRDARKAAKLTNESIRQTHELKLKEAEKTFNKAQEIIQKYEENRKSEDFFREYQRYRDNERRLPPE
jgi:hypothetical protein